jgi:hypothetical protein
MIITLQVKAGDKLLAVGGLPVSGLEYQELAKLVLGPEVCISKEPCDPRKRAL